MRYFEDFTPGQVIDMGPCRVSEAEIIAFARRYDNQDFHTDPAAARLTPFGGIVASGWHTIALCMRMMADGYLRDADGTWVARRSFGRDLCYGRRSLLQLRETQTGPGLKHHGHRSRSHTGVSLSPSG